ncbi:uncharacterized protein G2W53_017533 [Senna tora]|uniref:Uncharacterized protein n=1 Tax=Senna tora TaxID=362788 RepID=A0A834WQW6_9FABA|nr:uncharacterized protein G2W53_017533 [Senna tora]
MRCSKSDDGGLVRFEEWCKDSLSATSFLSDRDKALAAAMCWQIWKDRCSFMYQDITFDLFSMNSDLALRLWKKSFEDVLKYNTNGAFNGDLSHASLAVVFRDHMGKILMA